MANEDRPAVRETLAIPPDVRAYIDQRDRQTCRMCGRFLGDERAIHHIDFGGSGPGMGGRRVHDADKMVTLCWLWRGNCHDRAHREKRRWQPLLFYCATHGGVTALQLERWQRRSGR